MQVRSHQVQRKEHATYKLWDGKVIVNVQLSRGIDDFQSATIVITRELGAQQDIRTEVWYQGEKATYTPFQWVARHLTALSQKTDNTSCDVEGLCYTEA